MKKVFIATFVCVFSLSVLACDGNGSKGKSGQENQEDQRVELSR